MSKKIGSEVNTKQILAENDFFIKKKFGQNFLIDQNILNNIVDCADIDDSIDVIEIGPGLGSLTEIIASKAKRVLCYEIDKDLIPILKNNLSDYNNVNIINEDVLKCNVEDDIKNYFPNSSKVVLIANLPYYITTPIILTLLESTKMIKEYVMMMQEEVADRICSKPSVKDYNALSIVIQYRARARKVMKVSSNVFIPKPAVDSAVIRLDLYDEIPQKANNEKEFFKLIRGAFAQRRKTLVNNLSLIGYSKEDIYNALQKLNIKENARSEELTVSEFIDLSNILN